MNQWEGSAESNGYFETVFSPQRVMAILRGYSPDATVDLCERAWAVGIDVVEVPIQSPDAVPSLRAAAEAAHRVGREVGAGTITSLEQLDDARVAGARFTVAPGFDPDVARASLSFGMPHLCGVATSTEIQAALRAGFEWLKAFPAAELGASWFAAQLAPFPLVRFVATGGIGPHNADDFFTAGVRVAAMGSAFADPAQLVRIAELSPRPGAH